MKKESNYLISRDQDMRRQSKSRGKSIKKDNLLKKSAIERDKVKFEDEIKQMKLFCSNFGDYYEFKSLYEKKFSGEFTAIQLSKELSKLSNKIYSNEKEKLETHFKKYIGR